MFGLAAGYPELFQPVHQSFMAPFVILQAKTGQTASRAALKVVAPGAELFTSRKKGRCSSPLNQSQRQVSTTMRGGQELTRVEKLHVLALEGDCARLSLRLPSGDPR